MSDDAKRVDIIEEMRKQFAMRNPPEGGSGDVMSHVAAFVRFLVSEKGIAALLLVGVLGFLLTRGNDSIKELRVSVDSCLESNTAVMYQNEKVIERVDKQFREIEQREQEDRIRSLSRQFPGYQQERAE